jgi:DNA-binding NarL/FixJ family response regulator
VLDKIVAGVATARRQPKHDQSARLTAREQEVLRLLADGLDNAAIAGRLGITGKTVRDHISRALGQLGLRDRTQAALWAKLNLPSDTAGGAGE